MTSATDRRALKALHAACTPLVKGKDFAAIILPVSLCGLKIHILEINFETGDWRLCEIRGNGLSSLAARLLGIAEKDAEKRIAGMLTKENIQ